MTLRFTLDNQSTFAATSIRFTDNLDVVLDDLVATVPPDTAAAGCGTGSVLVLFPGGRSLTFAGGALAAGTSCELDVTLEVPLSAAVDVYDNVTSNVTALIDGELAVVDGAVDELTVIAELLLLAKEFIGDPVAPWC